MDAIDFFAIAERYQSSRIEAECRTSIGRSYYALFNTLVGVLSAKGVIFRGTPEDHYKLISYLTKDCKRAAAFAGSALKDLRLERNRADYDMTAAMRSKTSEFVYQKAIKAMNEFQSIAPPDLELIVERIQAMP
jgi:hypothetical protein